MRWINRAGRTRWLTIAVPATLVACAILVSGAAPGKHLSVYSTAANYSLPIVQIQGHDYVGLLELLEPLGRVSAKADGSRWRVRYNNVQGEFQSGKTKAHVQGLEIELAARFLMDNDRGLVPVASLTSLLPRILGGPVTLHEEADRLFIGSVGTHFTASLAGENRLVFNFSTPVNPMIATEPGALRMTFSREPVVSPASPTLTFGSKTIPLATYTENEGNAVLTVRTTIPVIASFSNDGRTITLAPASVTAASGAQKAAPPSSPAAAAPASPPAATPTAPTTTTPAPQLWRRYFAVVDASHGGDDHGETLSPTLMEKDVTVVFARALRQELESRSITTLVLRDSDANLSTDQRAVYANADRAAIYVALHASSYGHGVRVYTSLLPYGEDDRGLFRSWSTAQRAALPLSQTAANAVATELQKRQIPVRTLSAPLSPLNNITGAAIAVEIAPQGSETSQLNAPDYQQLITSAIATAIASAHDQLGAATGGQQ